MVKITAIVLAAGTSSRMGAKNKLLLPWGNQTIVDEVISQLMNYDWFELIVVTSSLSIHHFDGRAELSVIDNPDYESGMTSSIQKGVKYASPKADGYLICLGDQPLIQSSTYQEIAKAFEENYPTNNDCIIVPFHQEIKGNPVIFSNKYKAEILKHTERDGCRSIIKSHKENIIQCVTSNAGIITDIDTPEDYEVLRKKFLDT